MKKVWDEVKVSIKSGIPAHTFRMWIEPLQLARCDENRIVLYSPNFFFRKRVLENFGALIESEIKSVLGRECQLSIKISAKNSLPKPKAYEDPQLLLPNINVCPRNGRLLKKD
ncbi:MAG: chromosomal replication initiator protein DnaA, partial [Desulfobacteraceae bacterium]|nr:chromosomal replication initiator protein DnaA [Desulfobacteraceae bacterium]